MKTRSLLFAIVALLGTAGLNAQQEPESARTSFYTSLTAIYASPGWDDTKDGYGGSIAINATSGGRHIVEGEIMYLRFDGSGNSGELHILPILANYRYYIPFGATSGWGLEAGGSIGMSMMKIRMVWPGSTLSDTTWVATLGGQATVVYKFSKSTFFKAGLRALWTDKADYNLTSEMHGDGSRAKAFSDAATMLLVTAGLTFSF